MCIRDSIKNVGDAQVGDTVTSASTPAADPLPGYQRVVPMVYCGLYPQDSNDFNSLREAMERLKLNDAAITYEPETSMALGPGFRCGFLGLLHMDICLLYTSIGVAALRAAVRDYLNKRTDTAIPYREKYKK